MAGNEIFVNPRPFGLKQIAFPGNCQVSPDGKWVAFMDGSRSYLAIWDFAQNQQVWTQKLACGSHRFTFARKASKHVAGISETSRLRFTPGTRQAAALVIMSLFFAVASRGASHTARLSNMRT